MSNNNLPNDSEAPLHRSENGEKVITVFFKESGITANWSDEHESLLEFAEAQGLTPDFSCRAGICNTCHCELIEGDVEYIDEPLVEPETGYVLPCISKPKTNLVIDL